MGQPVVHFEVMGKDAAKIRSFYSDMFDWTINVMGDGPVSYATVEDAGIGGGIGASADMPNHVTFYVGVPEVEAALGKAESLGGARLMGPDQVPGGPVIGLFGDPDGNMVGVVRAS